MVHGKIVSGSIETMSDTFKDQTNLISQMISDFLQFLQECFILSQFLAKHVRFADGLQKTKQVKIRTSLKIGLFINTFCKYFYWNRLYHLENIALKTLSIPMNKLNIFHFLCYENRYFRHMCQILGRQIIDQSKLRDFCS